MFGLLTGARFVELHLHLDISMSFTVARRLVPGLPEERYQREFCGPARCASLAEFLATTSTQVALLQKPDALRLLSADVVRRIADEGVVYAELRFAPLLHTHEGMSPEAAVEAVLDASFSAAEEAGINVGVILTSLRHFDASDSLRTADLAVRYRPHGVVGFDLGGDEAGYPLSTHLPGFFRARDAGLPYTVHAGEGSGPESVAEVLASLHPARVGHGVRAVEDPAVVGTLLDQGVHLEVCPTCNVQLGLYPDLRAHPIDQLYRRGVSLSVSTDSRTSTVTTMPGEFAGLRAAFGWTDVDIDTVSRMAIEAAFASKDVKNRIRRRLLHRR
jgi:adenosine deaminase